MTHGEKIKARILVAGLSIWREKGLQALTARGVAKEMKMTHANILHHMCTAAALKDAIAAEAVRTGCDVIVPQLIAMRHSAVALLTAAERAEYLAKCS